MSFDSLRRSLPSRRIALALVLATLSLPITARAQQATAGAGISLSLDDALRIAQEQSQTVAIARAGVVGATGQRMQARSQYMPQLNGTAGYTKTLKSQFSSFSSSTPVVDTTPKTQSLCTPPIASNATPEQRAAALAQAASCPSASGGFGFDLSKTSFGATNQWALALSFSQNLFAGGRIRAQNDAADAQLRSANIEVGAQRAQVSLDVTSSYYDAVLADQLVAIADSSVAETEVVLSQTKLARQVGNASEYELLRAQVTHDNQLPVAIQARSNRQVAYLRLKQLLNMPLDNVLTLTTGIEGANGPTLPAIASASMDTSVIDRSAVREIDEAVRVSEAQVRIARSERIPSLALVSNYQRLYFPSELFPTLSNGVNNWTVGLSTNFPIFDGGRIRGDITVAQAGLQRTRAQREQTRQFAALDTRVALNSLQEAQSTWDASRGTAEQAQRAYAIDQVRYREGISTQTDLTQSRLLLEQALANRAQAARNLAVARVRLALIRDLPLQAQNNALGATGGGAAGATQNQQQQQQQQAQQLQTQQQRTNPSAGGTSGGSGGIQP